MDEMRLSEPAHVHAKECGRTHTLLTLERGQYKTDEEITVGWQSS